MKTTPAKPSSFIQVLLDMYMFHVVINKSYKRSIFTNPKNQLVNNSNINFA